MPSASGNKETSMSSFTPPAGTLPRGPGRSSHDRQKVLRWATVAVLLLLAAVAASRA